MSTISTGSDEAPLWSASDQRQSVSKWLSAVLARDYFPGLNPFIDWLRQPLGWFVVAACASSLLGIFISPIGWSITAGLISVIAAGLAFPWLAVRWTKCTLQPQTCELEEGEAGELLLTVRNPLPVPLFGLTVERFLVQPVNDSHDNCDALDGEAPLADIGLAQVDWLSQASFQLPICSQLRGRYPLSTPTLACSFPFGIWTARRPIEMVEQVSVLPRRIAMGGMSDFVGHAHGDTGLGNRTGGHGDLLGVRDYQRGDSMRSIHWAQTAKMNSIIVCQRGAPERPTWQIHVDGQRSIGPRHLTRENLAWRVRIAASLASLLAHQSIPFRLAIAGEEHDGEVQGAVRTLTIHGMPNHLRAALQRLTDVPLDGYEPSEAHAASQALKLRKPATGQHGPNSVTVCISPLSADIINHSTTPLATTPVAMTPQHKAQPQRYVLVSLRMTTSALRSTHGDQTTIIDLEADVSDQLCHWMRNTSQSFSHLGNTSHQHRTAV